MKVCEPQWEPVCGKTLTRYMSDKVAGVQQKVREELSSVQTLSVTVDIWSDRRMRGYLGVTAHYYLDEHLKTCLLSCDRYAV